MKNSKKAAAVSAVNSSFRALRIEATRYAQSQGLQRNAFEPLVSKLLAAVNGEATSQLAVRELDNAPRAITGHVAAFRAAVDELVQLEIRELQLLRECLDMAALQLAAAEHEAAIVKRPWPPERRTSSPSEAAAATESAVMAGERLNATGELPHGDKEFVDASIPLEDFHF